jgi:hypothetical protein
LKGKARTIIERTPAAPHDADFSLKMALLTDGFPQNRLQMAGIDDRGIPAGHLFAPLMPADVQLARSVATLAADGISLENRRTIPVQGVGYLLDAVAVAEQASRGNEPGEVMVVRSVSGRQIPDMSLGIPRDRRLKEITVMVDQVRSTSRAGTDRELDLGLRLGQHAALRVLFHLSVHDPMASPLDTIVKAKSPEIRILGYLGEFRGAGVSERHQRAPHRMLAKGTDQLRMAAGAGLIADVLDLGSDVAIGRGKGKSGVAGRRTRRTGR